MDDLELKVILAGRLGKLEDRILDLQTTIRGQNYLIQALVDKFIPERNMEETNG